MRNAPAYQRYPADHLTGRTAREMSAAERGVWSSIQDQLWIDEMTPLPTDPERLGKILGLSSQDMAAGFTDAVRSKLFVDQECGLVGDDGLREQWVKHIDRRTAQSAAGRVTGSANKGRTRKRGEGDGNANHNGQYDGYHNAQHHGQHHENAMLPECSLSTDQIRSDQYKAGFSREGDKQKKEPEMDPELRAWIADHDAEDARLNATQSMPSKRAPRTPISPPANPI